MKSFTISAALLAGFGALVFMGTAATTVPASARRVLILCARASRVSGLNCDSCARTSTRHLPSSQIGSSVLTVSLLRIYLR